MKIEAKGKIKDKPLDTFYNLEAGDQVTVPDAVGENWVRNGWAKNLDTGEDNAPSKNPVTLDIQNSTLGVSDTLEG